MHHGLLRTSSAGWTLSPAFDLNPNPSPGPKRLCTTIDFSDPTASVDTLVGVASYFRLSDDDIRLTLGEVLDATGRWRTVAREAGVGSSAAEYMAPAFEHDQAERARQIVAP
jgi:serine/threonine-protein kinase HipA